LKFCASSTISRSTPRSSHRHAGIGLPAGRELEHLGDPGRDALGEHGGLALGEVAGLGGVALAEADLALDGLGPLGVAGDGFAGSSAVRPNAEYVSRATSNSPAWKRVHFAARSAGVSVSEVSRPLPLTALHGHLAVRADDRHPVVGQDAVQDVRVPTSRRCEFGTTHHRAPATSPSWRALGEHREAGVGLADADVEGEQRRRGWRARAARRRSGAA
jgi:hypothetical protein